MGLPEGFSEWEHLQDMVRLEHNKMARKFFSDTNDDSVGTPREKLKHACIIKDNDTGVMTFMRLWLFEVNVRHTQSIQAPIYGIPVTAFKEQRKYKPQIKLYFQEDYDDVETGYAPITGEITFRLMDEEYNTISKTFIESLANKVKTSFAAPSFVWKKGKELYCYAEWKKGYQLQLLCRDETEAKRVIEQVLDIQSHSPNWKHLTKSEAAQPATKYPTIPGNVTVLGKSRRLPRQRPIADVRFIYATLHIHELPNPVVLIDRSGLYQNPVVKITP